MFRETDKEYKVYNDILDLCDPKLNGEIDPADMAMICMMVIATITHKGTPEEKRQVLDLIPEVMNDVWRAMDVDDLPDIKTKTDGGEWLN